jgi:hypothetical protein
MIASAPIHTTAEDQRVRAEAAAWRSFVAPGDDAQLVAAWLALLAGRVQRVRAGMVLLAGEDGASFSVGAVWPDPQRDLKHLGPAAQRALTERRGVLVTATGAPALAGHNAHVAYPVALGDALCGAVVLEIGGGDLADLQTALREVHWAIAWLVDHFRAQRQRQEQAEAQRMAVLNGLVATALQHRLLRPSALAVANELCAALRCDRVSVGFEQGGQVQPLVISHTATFDARSDLLRHLGAAMDEAFDLGITVVHPPQGDDGLRALAHAESAQALQVQAMMSVPLVDAGQPIGVLTLERAAGPAFEADDRRLAHAVAAMLGPAWGLQRMNGRSTWQRLREGMQDARTAVFGPQRPGLKLVAAVAVAAVLVVTLVRTDHRVAARTSIEGATQLAAVAPFDGFVAQGLVRAGDTVRSGQPMARLDDRDLTLEAARWRAERDQLLRRYQVAFAAADRGAMGVIGAQVNQAEAQLSLAEDKLARIVLTAPFDGVVVSGDLSQLIGSPVEQGKLLFEVAPLEGYRVVLNVDDRDIGRLAVDQRGELVLASLPGRVLAFTVRSITPVSTQQDGRNVFRVEAVLDQAAELGRLRPGMEGVGKVVVGEASLLWIWTHGFVDWLRLSLWNWLP